MSNLKNFWNQDFNCLEKGGEKVWFLMKEEVREPEGDIVHQPEMANQLDCLKCLICDCVCICYCNQTYLLNPQDGLVYAVEFSHRSGRDLINVAKKRTNIIPIIEDARHPHKYRMLVGRYTNELSD